MSKYLVETFYTCSFKIIHKLDELTEKKLLDLEKRNDGKVQIIDVKLNNRKTRRTDKKETPNDSLNKFNKKDISEISSAINEKIVTSTKGKFPNELDSKNINIPKFNKKTNERSKMPDRRKGYIQKVSIGDHKIYLHTGE